MAGHWPERGSPRDTPTPPGVGVFASAIGVLASPVMATLFARISEASDEDLRSIARVTSLSMATIVDTLISTQTGRPHPHAAAVARAARDIRRERTPDATASPPRLPRS